MCVCLFSALSRRVGALQISIVIIIAQYQYFLHVDPVVAFSVFCSVPVGYTFCKRDIHHSIAGKQQHSTAQHSTV